MNLLENYDKMYQDSVQKIQTDKYQIDDLIDSPFDKRRGISLLIRPDIEIKKNIQQFLKVLKVVEPDQYYYPNSDVHITVMSIISCYSGFDLAEISLYDYISLINNSLHGIKSFKVHLKGITISPSCVMIQGFLEDNTLNEVRNKLRFSFKNSNLH